MKVNDKDYEVIKLLGRGKGGYSYLVKDNNKYYVLKNIHHEPCSYYQFGDKIHSELNDYNHLKEIGINIPTMVAIDYENERILKEYIDGPNCYELVNKDLMSQEILEKVVRISRKAKYHNINIDYFPTNFVLKDNELYYIDYECNEYKDEWSFENWGKKYWSKTKDFEIYELTHREDDFNQYFKLVKKCVDREDMMNLLEINCPSDEYDHESEMIASSISSFSSKEEICTIVYEVFSKMFEGLVKKNRCDKVGEDIFNSLNKDKKIIN
jgi:predicted Ser/Thr protein kinase